MRKADNFSFRHERGEAVSANRACIVPEVHIVDLGRIVLRNQFLVEARNIQFQEAEVWRRWMGDEVNYVAIDQRAAVAVGRKYGIPKQEAGGVEVLIESESPLLHPESVGGNEIFVLLYNGEAGHLRRSIRPSGLEARVSTGHWSELYGLCSPLGRAVHRRIAELLFAYWRAQTTRLRTSSSLFKHRSY